MLDYLVNYGVKRMKVDYDDLDVIDKMKLQDQINQVRKDRARLLELKDQISGELIACSRDISMRSKWIFEEAVRLNEKPKDIFNTDLEYLELEVKRDALRTGIGMVNDHLDSTSSDLRILNSVFYSKF